VPTNIFLAGWFVDSVKPGQKGNSIIDGHVDGYHHDGIFKNLSKLKKGNRYTVVNGDDSTQTFEVVSVQSVPVEQAAGAIFSHDPSIKSQVTLVTCGGTFNEQKRAYSERLIIISKKI